MGSAPRNRTPCVFRNESPAPSQCDSDTVGALASQLARASQALSADVITVLLRQGRLERRLVFAAGQLREAPDSLFPQTLRGGSGRLTGILGLLQATEFAAQFGFSPGSYFTAPFGDRRSQLAGTVTAWSRRSRRWTAAEGSLLRRLARKIPILRG